MNFSDIIGQKKVITSIKNSIRNDRVSHAYILEGSEGIGKQTIASIFASALMCEMEQDTDTKVGEPCLECKSCIKCQSGNHPDIKIIKDKIGIDTIRDFQKDIYIKPYESDRKIYIITHAEKMTVQAQNSLLKVFEEPPRYGVIILTVENASQLLDTILSRAILIRFQVHPQSEVELYLREEYPDLKEKIPVLAAFSGGIIGKAKAIATSEEFGQMRQEVIEIAGKFLNNSELEVLEATSYFVEHKAHIDSLLEFLLSWFRDVLLIKVLYNSDKVINMDMKNKLEVYANQVRTSAVERIIHVIIDIKKKISINTNYQLAIETMLMRSWEEIHGRSRNTF